MGEESELTQRRGVAFMWTEPSLHLCLVTLERSCPLWPGLSLQGCDVVGTACPKKKKNKTLIFRWPESNHKVLQHHWQESSRALSYACLIISVLPPLLSTHCKDLFCVCREKNDFPQVRDVPKILKFAKDLNILKSFTLNNWATQSRLETTHQGHISLHYYKAKLQIASHTF